jgi:hypothetical protein
MSDIGQVLCCVVVWDQTANSSAAQMTTAAAVAKWMPNVTAFGPPWRSTMTVSPSGGNATIAETPLARAFAQAAREHSACG